MGWGRCGLAVGWGRCGFAVGWRRCGFAVSWRRCGFAVSWRRCGFAVSWRRCGFAVGWRRCGFAVSWRRCAVAWWVVGRRGRPVSRPRRGRPWSRRFLAPLFAPGPAGGSPDIPSDHRACAALPPYRSPLRPCAAPLGRDLGRTARSLGAAEVGAVTGGATGRQSAALDGWRGCTGARPQDWSERRGAQFLVAASPAPRTGPGASPPTPAATTQPARRQLPPTRTTNTHHTRPKPPPGGRWAPSQTPRRRRTTARHRGVGLVGSEHRLGLGELCRHGDGDGDRRRTARSRRRRRGNPWHASSTQLLTRR